jgi:hypothetical protein
LGRLTSIKELGGCFCARCRLLLFGWWLCAADQGRDAPEDAQAYSDKKTHPALPGGLRLLAGFSRESILLIYLTVC